MEFAYISVQGWIVDTYKQCFCYCSFEVLVLPPHYTKIFYSDVVTSDVGVVKYGEGAFCCSLNLSPNTLEDSPMYSSSQSTLLHLYL